MSKYVEAWSLRLWRRRIIAAVAAHSAISVEAISDGLQTKEVPSDESRISELPGIDFFAPRDFHLFDKHVVRFVHFVSYGVQVRLLLARPSSAMSKIFSLLIVNQTRLEEPKIQAESSRLIVGTNIIDVG